jgi:threonylcarbamoyladenosine tRNA methylthiotransferase MtaB
LKYSVVTFGCRVNQADSLGFEEGLIANGGIAVAPEFADLVVVNTCSVTATADQGARQTIRRVARENPGARIVVTGCYATRQPDDVCALPSVVQVVSNDDKPKLLNFVRNLYPSAGEDGVSTAVRFGDGDGSCGAAIEPGVAGRTAFTLRVQTGCAERCSYCIIPATRGRPRSLDSNVVLSEIDRVAVAGFKEIVLTGVHLGSYGRDMAPASSLFSLLGAIDARYNSGAARQPRLLFRISSLEPMDCPRELVDLVAAGGCFAPHFHLPLQHASNRMLTSMRRPYTVEYYASLVDYIRRQIPHASIGSDVIVGFPGETDDDFEQLTSYLAQSPLTHVHVFPYSDRPGTVASSMKDRPGGSIVRDRGRRVRDIAQQLSRRFRQSQVGSVRPALTIDDGTLAVTDNYQRVAIPPGRARNEWIDVRIE